MALLQMFIPNLNILVLNLRFFKVNSINTLKLAIKYFYLKLFLIAKQVFWLLFTHTNKIFFQFFYDLM